MSVFQSPKNGPFRMGITHDFGKKKPRFSSFFSILVKIRPEIMFNDVLNAKEASLENKDFFKMILGRKKFKFFLYMFLVKIRLKTESSAFHRLALSSI